MTGSPRSAEGERSKFTPEKNWLPTGQVPIYMKGSPSFSVIVGGGDEAVAHPIVQGSNTRVVKDRLVIRVGPKGSGRVFNDPL